MRQAVMMREKRRSILMREKGLIRSGGIYFCLFFFRIRVKLESGRFLDGTHLILISRVYYLISAASNVVIVGKYIN